jgi:hypothetical protein
MSNSRKKSILELKAVSLRAALVASLYFARAVGKQNPVENLDDRQKIAEFLQEQKALQRNLLGSLRKDPYLRSACSGRRLNTIESSWLPETNSPCSFVVIPAPNSQSKIFPTALENS